MTHTENNELTTSPGARYQPGELVDVTIRGARVVAPDDCGLLDLAVGNFRTIANLRNAGYTVTRRAPAEWPPQPADIWRDRNGDTWAALDGPDGIEMCRTHTQRSTWQYPDNVLEQYGPMRLEYRPGWTPPQPADTEPAEVDERANYVAGLRAVADFFEQRTDLPVPNDQETLQHTVLAWQDDVRLSDEQRFAEIARIAAALGVEASEDGQTVRYEIAERLIYVAHTYPASKPKPEPVVDGPLVDERGDAEKTQQVEEDAAERAAFEAEVAAEFEQDARDAALAGPPAGMVPYIGGGWIDEQTGTIYPAPAQRETAE